MITVDIDQLDDPRLDPYRQLHQTNLTRHSGRFIAESPLLVQRLLASALHVESILVGRRYLPQIEPWLRPSDTPTDFSQTTPTILVVPDDAISQIVGFQFHRGVLACGLRPPNPDLQAFIEPGDSMLVVCPQIVDPTNLASVIRNASALGASGLLLGPSTADPYSRRVARVSMGTLFTLPLRIADNLSDDLEQLARTHGFTRVATVLDPRAVPLTSATRPRRLALLFGSEGHGLDALTLQHCDERVTLAMHRQTDSLNVGTSTGIFLYHYAYVAERRAN